MARSYHPNFCEDVIAYLRTGEPLSGFAEKMNVSIELIKTWTQQYPEFKEAVEIAENANMYFWERYGICGALGISFHYGKGPEDDKTSTTFNFDIYQERMNYHYKRLSENGSFVIYKPGKLPVGA